MSGRTLHFVIRCTDLQKGLRFLEGVFSMKVLRHEENAEPCAIACNGKYNSAWSKTMVGFDKHTEDKYYCLEVVHNYGVPNYPAPCGLQSIHVATADPAAALKEAEQQGYAVDGRRITGPDGYTYVVEDLPSGRGEPFKTVSVGVRDLAASRKWYVDGWGFQDLTSSCGGDAAKECYVGWPAEAGCGEGAPLHLVHTPGVVVDPQIDGRHAVAIPTEALKARYAQLEKDFPDTVVFPIRNLSEDKLGALYLAITKDPDGHELCTVSKETFDPAVANPPYNAPDWAWREKFTKEGGAAFVADAAVSSAELRVVGDDDWDAQVAKDKLTVVWFTADWCAPCKKVRPEFEKLVAAHGSEKIDFVKCVVDDATETVEEAEVSKPPTFQLWRAAKKISSFEGADKLPALTEAVTAAAA